LGYVHDAAKVRGALKALPTTIFRIFALYFNPMRSFVLNDERGLVMASTMGQRPKKPFR
jgi:hypothetical protein